MKPKLKLTAKGEKLLLGGYPRLSKKGIGDVFVRCIKNGVKTIDDRAVKVAINDLKL